MIEDILKDEIISIFRELKIGIIYLFGSYILGTETEDSDIDIGIVFLENEVLEKPLEVYDILYKIFSEIYPSKEIDIVFLNKAPLTLKFEVVNTGKVLYSVSEEICANFKERVVKEYIDFKPLLDEQDRALLERI